MRAKSILLPAVATAILLCAGCSHEIANPSSPTVINDVIPPTPENLIASTGDGSIGLSWSVPGDPSLLTYRIYMAPYDSAGTTFSLVGEASARAYTAVNLRNGDLYYFKVSSVNADGFEGYRSDSVYATPNQPVELYPPFATPGTFDQLELNWSASGDSDFFRYELYRSDDSQVDSLDTIVFSSPVQTSFTDTGLQADSLYYYSVLTRDLTGSYSWSNIAGGRTNIDTPPQSVALFPVIVQPDNYQNISIEWGRSMDDDFESYRLYRWREDLGRDDSLNIALVTSFGTTSFDDSPPFEVAADTMNFWYILYVYDTGGNATASDSIRIHLVDNNPPTVPGSVEPSTSSLIVAWITPDIPDFAIYHLLRDIDSDPAGAITVYVSSDQTVSSYDDALAAEGQTYFYWLDIYDLRNNVSRSALGSGSW